MSGNLASATDGTADPGFSLEPSGNSRPGFCAHCGKESRSISGFIHEGEVTRAAYLVHWTLGVSEHPANFDLILGPWGDRANAAERLAVSLIYRNDAEQRGFTAIDANGRTIDTPEMVGRALSRGELVGSPALAEWVFTLAGFVLHNDSRIGTIQTEPQGRGSGSAKSP